MLSSSAYPEFGGAYTSCLEQLVAAGVEAVDDVEAADADQNVAGATDHRRVSHA